MTPPQDFHDLLPDYVLGLLDKATARQMEAALAADPDLQHELEAYNAMFDALALAVPQIEPPADLGAKLMAQIAPSPKVSPLPVSTTRGRWNMYLAAAAVFLVVLVGIVLYLQSRPPQDEIAQVLEDDQRSTYEIVSSETVDLEGQLIVDGKFEKAVLNLENLEPLTGDQAYQVWLVGEGELRTSALVFQSETPQTKVLFNLPKDFRGTYRAIGVTVEPAGGSPAPTGEPVFWVMVE